MSEPFTLHFGPANDRGFTRADFKDRNGEACSMQESSLQYVEGEEDGGPCIWLGQNEGTHHRGHCLARMHLTQDMAREIGLVLLHFAETGELVGIERPKCIMLGCEKDAVDPDNFGRYCIDHKP